MVICLVSRSVHTLTSCKRDAPIPLPKITRFNTVSGPRNAKNRSLESQEKSAQKGSMRAARVWAECTPTYRIPRIKLSELMHRPKNRPDDINNADAMILRMRGSQADACSARFVDDESGETLVCVFSHRTPATSNIAPQKDMVAKPGRKSGKERRVIAQYFT